MGGRLDPAVAAVRRAVRDACGDVEPGASVVVACSGGPDSMALAAGAVFEGRDAGWLVGAATVDHQLQPGSDQVAAEVASRLTALGCDPVDVVTVSVGLERGPEAAARAARYEALEELAANRNAVVLLGHTRDDQAESVLLGLARGSGTRSMAGMAARRGRFRRPLISLPRRTTQQACDALGLQTWADPHNADPRFARARVRVEVIPVLERELGPGVSEALARTAELARYDADALDTLALDLGRIASRGANRLDVRSLADAFAALRHRVIRVTAIEAGCPAGDLTAHHVAEVARLITDWHGQAWVELPGQVTVSRARTDSDEPHLHFIRRP